MPKAVIDANVFISGLLTAGSGRRLIEFLEQDKYQLFYPPLLIVELRKTQARPKLASRIKPNRLLELIDLIECKGILVEVREPPAVSRDPKDDDYLECAQLAQTDFIVSGDNDLLCLNTHAGVKILSPATFLQLLEF